MSELLHEPEFWVGIGFLLLVAALWKPAGKAMGGALDQRADRIRKTLDEARALATEAQHLLTENQRKSRDSAREIDRMVEHAREEAERIVAEARVKLEASLRRREQLAREKIALAETDATREVREVAVEVAVAATRELIAAHLDKTAGDRLIASAIEELPARMH